jgi:hypothetical protein
MEASLLDMTRGHAIPMFVFSVFDATLEVDIEVVRDEDDGEYDVVIEYVFERAPIEDAFVDPWFAAHDTELAVDEDLPVAPIASAASLHAVLGIAAAVALAACLYGATL